MSLAQLLLVVLWLHADVARAHPFAAAIAATDATPGEATTLLAIALHENSLDPSRGVPLGMCARLCRTHCGGCHREPLVDTARAALHVLRVGMAECGTLAGALARYHHGGGCRVDAFAAREARSVARVRARAVRP